MDFDINVLRTLSTVLAFLCFIGIFAWTFSAKRQSTYTQMANLPLQDDSCDEVHS